MVWQSRLLTRVKQTVGNITAYIRQYQKELAAWKALPSWKRMKTRKHNMRLELLKKMTRYQQQKDLLDLMKTMCADGCETDEIPNGYGEFGHEPTNPIPTNTIFGSTSYLSCLRAPDGATVAYDRLGSLLSPVSFHMIDAYRILHPDGRHLAILYLSPYHKRNSEKAPRGFVLLKTNME